MSSASGYRGAKYFQGFGQKIYARSLPRVNAILGVANERSIAWGIAKTLADNGAELAFSYQNESFKKRLIPLMNSIKSIRNKNISQSRWSLEFLWFVSKKS